MFNDNINDHLIKISVMHRDHGIFSKLHIFFIECLFLAANWLLFLFLIMVQKNNIKETKENNGRNIKNLRWFLAIG